MSEKFIVIDGNSIMHRAYHALPYLSSDGVSTNAVYGFMSMLIKVIKEQQPAFLGVCFDVSKKVFRHEFFEDYKAGRKKTDPELIEQFPIIKEFFEAMGVPIVEREGFEADDLIGSICKTFGKVDTYILTGDKDSLQLIDENTFVFLMKKGISDVELYDTDAFVEVYGVKPSQFVDVKALMGDKSDNIPGVTKVGEKTALRLISDYGNLEGVYDNLDKEKGKLKENLEKDKDMAFLSQRLAQIDTGLEIENKIEEFAFDEENLKRCYPLLEKYNMKSLIGRSKANVKGASADQEEEEKSPKIQGRIAPVVTVSQPEELVKAVEGLEQEPLVMAVTEDSVYFSDGRQNYCVKQQMSLFEESLGREQVFGVLREHVEKNGIICDDGKAMLRYMDEYFFSGEIVFDVGLAAYLVDSSWKDYSIDSLVKFFTDDAPVSALALYRIYMLLKERIEDYRSIYYDIEMPLTHVLYSMEKEGFAIDVNVLQELSKEYRGEMVRLEQEIFEIAGESFNLNSPKQLSHILFEKLELKSGKKTKTGYSTDAESLEKIREQSPIIDKVLDYRKFSKLIGTYIDGFLPLIDKGGRIHTEFLQKGTVTGRIASKEPNLQNIPVRSDQGREIRKAFVAKEGYTLVCADYSQIELRVLAHISGDEVMIDAFNKGQDIHTRTASEVFGVPMDEVDKLMRRSAKAVNFGIVYGLSPYGLSTNLSIPFKVAKEYIDSYFARYSGVRAYMSDIVEEAKNNGYVDTLLGRRRYVPQLRASNRNMVAFGERVALNTPIQGTAADMIKIAMNKVFEELINTDSRLILQVHDELIVEAKDDEVEEVKNILRNCMENVLELKVPVVVDITADKRWLK